MFLNYLYLFLKSIKILLINNIFIKKFLYQYILNIKYKYHSRNYNYLLF